MKMRMQAEVIYEWEDDSENWPEFENKEPTEEEFLALVQKYAKDDASYVFDCDISSITIAKGKK